VSVLLESTRIAPRQFESTEKGQRAVICESTVVKERIVYLTVSKEEWKRRRSKRCGGFFFAAE
jgi:hypothetical protein